MRPLKLINNKFDFKEDTILNYSSSLKKQLNKLINAQSNHKSDYLYSPEKDFSRKRKISYEDVIKMTITSVARSLRNELMTFYNYKKSVTASAYCQQRSKIKKEAFKDLFYSFNSILDKTKNYNG